MKRTAIVILFLPLAGCVSSSDVMPGADGSYFLQVRASPIRGGAAGATDIAYEDANAFCASQKARAVVLDLADKDSYRGSFYEGNGGIVAAGRATLHFKCQN